MSCMPVGLDARAAAGHAPPSARPPPSAPAVAHRRAMDGARCRCPPAGSPLPKPAQTCLNPNPTHHGWHAAVGAECHGLAGGIVLGVDQLLAVRPQRAARLGRGSGRAGEGGRGRAGRLLGACWMLVVPHGPPVVRLRRASQAEAEHSNSSSANRQAVTHHEGHGVAEAGHVRHPVCT